MNLFSKSKRFDVLTNVKKLTEEICSIKRVVAAHYAGRFHSVLKLSGVRRGNQEQ